jgi:hypothetical protein
MLIVVCTVGFGLSLSMFGVVVATYLRNRPDHR